ncbi:uncharacterized protein A1O9_07223 [Exophiala aquamarina CBS 119918]|uniref:aldehyde dehydrogenase (NAD(+)) n=1 Tax=Exophiala aquamarina CBS 119918 TaxID=1182545 RepID=A0A072PCK3_9EURO|nr:uncharacterized protein A1O9_07223 [Exophiala aquamarina CBS 119918]KEF57033.1 hypothetical protein A1O9_07223 [Exophiala aquamarina CBS 119918]
MGSIQEYPTKVAVPKYDKITQFALHSDDPSHLFDVHNPATGEVITTIQGCGEAEVAKAVAIAQRAYQECWKWKSPKERSELLLRCADHLAAHSEELALLLSMENGKPVTQARQADVSFIVNVYRFFGSLIDKLPSELYDQGSIYSSIVHEPYGVVAGILPFNWPPIHCGGKSAPALAAGNTIILKPGEQAPLTVMRIIELVSEILPKGVIQGIPAVGTIVPAALVSNPDVKKVSFTGSTRGGAAISKLAADNITHLSLELGGKNSLIIFEDADIDLAVRSAMDGGYFNQGEACTAASRVIVHRTVHDEVVSKMAAAVRRLKVGNGVFEETHVGPLITKAHQEKVQSFIELGLSEGAIIEAQAPLPKDSSLSHGFFVAPTLFSNVKRDMRIAREEMFGPIVTVNSFETYEEAISIANDTEYGLVTAIFSKDTTKALRAAREIDVGMAFINNYTRMALGTPFGGAKHSGYGREHCIETLREYSRPKSIRIPSGRGPIPAWQKVKDLFDYTDHGNPAMAQ